jgi:hemoglobin/transferrin/lactoferrin receptor protein
VLGDHELTLGLDLWERELTSDRTRQFASGATSSDTPLPDATYTSSGLFLEDTWFLHALSVSLGARVDAIRVENEATPQWEPRKENETSWNAHLGATMELGGNLLAKGLVARGYRAASLEERYAFLELGGGRVKLGDPDLEPEESLFTEWGLHWVDKRLSCGVSVYYNDLDQLISERVVDATTRVNANINEAEIYGIEAELRWLITPDWTLYANAAYAEGRDTQSNDALPGIPPLNGMTGLRYDRGAGFWAAAEHVFATRQDDVPPDVDPVAGWQTVDARAGYAFGGASLPQQVLVGVDNLFDETYTDYLTTSRGFTFNEPGRSCYVAYQAGW